MAYVPDKSVRSVLLVYTGVGDSDLRKFVDTFSDVPYWFFGIPHSLFITTSADLTQLTRRLVAKFGEDATFLFVPISADEAEGWAPEEIWRLVLRPDSPRVPAKTAEKKRS